MKFLEGKTPAERNKTVAAMVLGALAVVTLSYTFLWSGGSSTKKASAGNSNSNSKTAVVVNNDDSNSSASQIPTIAEVETRPYYDLTPIPENPFPPVFGGETSRNIFAIYVPPPPALLPRSSPLPEPSPMPTPPILVQFVTSNPNPVYAQQGDFTLELGGDKFTPDSKVLFNGQEIPTQFASAQRLTAKVPAALITAEGQKQIFVRTTDGSKMSNAMVFNVQTPPVPNYNFVGLVARTHYNNDTAMLQDKSSKEYKNVRLGEIIGRFKVVSISSKEVIMQDIALNFRHNLSYLDEKTAGGRAGGNYGGGQQQQTNDSLNNGYPNGFDPNVQIQPQQIPGIPNQYTQPQQVQPMPPQPKPEPSDDNDDNDDN